MSDNRKTSKMQGSWPLGRRPTIGCLIPIIGDESRGDSLHQAFWLGFTDAARKRNVNSICFPGGSPSDPVGFQAQANVLYELVNAENVEGVVSWGTSIGNYIGADELVAFHERYRPLPVVNAGGTLERFSSLWIDSYTSMRAAIVHLIEVHGYRRLAFIRGPENNFHARERYRAYVETLEAHGLPIDPRLITQPSLWGHVSGREAMRLLLDERGLRPHTDFEAVVGVNDELLVGALEVLQTRGVRVPGDVAVVGFDSSLEGRVHTPPLTSVASPHYEMGYRAVEMLLSLMEGGQVVEEALVPELVIHQSCGCLDSAIVQAAVDLGEVGGETFESFLASRREQAFSAMTQAVGESSKNVASGWEERLLEGFTGELKGGAPGLFLQELDEVMRQAMAAGGDVPAWQGAVSALRRQIVLYLDGERLRQAENLWQQARVMIGETAQRAQAYHAFQAAQQARTLREIEAALLTTFDVAGLMDMLAQNLPQLGIPSCYLALYEDPQPYRYPQPAPEWSRLVLAYTEQGRVELEPGGRRFRSCKLVPEGVLLQERPYNLVVEPLYFQDSQLGFVLFELGPREGGVYEALRGQISTALMGALLMHQLEEQTMKAEKAREAAEKANRAKSVFLASMSHELRTPLNAILGYAQILQRRPLDADVIDNLYTVQKSGEHLLTLINDILDIAKIEAGRMELYPVPIRFSAFMDHIAGIIRSRAEAKGLVFSFEKLSALPAGVQADETRLRQVLLNLLDNAVKFTEAGHVTLRVGTQSGKYGVGSKGREQPTEPLLPTPTNALPSHSLLRFEVEDTGIGIPPDQLERIFQPFEQAGDLAHRAKGTGLGLAISRQLVHLMGGDIHVESKVGQGSTFWFEVALPVTEVTVEAAQPPERTIIGYRGPRRTVLVVDDIPSNRAVLVDLLQPLGFDVVEAVDGQQAIRLAQEIRPDLILMDRWMPVLDGFEAAHQMQQIPELASVPIVAISASVAKEDQVQSRDASIDAFLPKPVNWPRLAALLQEYLALEWEYKKETEVGEKEGEAILVPPPAEEMELLLDLARRGDMWAIQERAAHIAALGEQYVPFARTLRELAQSFEEKWIWTLIERYMEHK